MHRKNIFGQISNRNQIRIDKLLNSHALTSPLSPQITPHAPSYPLAPLVGNRDITTVAHNESLFAQSKTTYKRHTYHALQSETT